MPYGACIVADAAEAAGHRTRLLDLMFQRDPVKAVEQALQAFTPEVIGLSIRNLDNNDMPAPKEFVTELAAVARTVRRCSPAPLVIGGPAVAVMPNALLKLTKASFAVLGDGETTFPALLGCLARGEPPTEVPRLAWMENGDYRISSDTVCSLHNSAIRPRWSKWLDLKAYRHAMTAVPIQSKRGCPFACIYCTYGISEGRGYRLYSPEEVAKAIKDFEVKGCKDIEFVDNVFNAPYEHALAVCDRLAWAHHALRLQTMELNPAFIDDTLLKAMEKAGFVGVGVTAESAADPVLSGLKKGYTAAAVGRAAESLGRSNLPCFWIFLLGGPGETPETVAETIRFARSTLRKGDVAFFNLGLRIYPGTELETVARKEGILSHTAHEMLEPVFYFSPQVEVSWALEQVRQATKNHLNIIHSGSLSHPWLPAINHLFTRLPLKRPLWQHTAGIRRVVRALGRDT